MRDADPVLFLTNNSNTDPFVAWLRSIKENVVVVTEPMSVELIESTKPVFVLSFNYRHIVKADIIEHVRGRIANVHCSVLPYNKGASPNFFSYYENTPKGVTVHEMRRGLDGGDILLQEMLDLGEDETFSSSYDKLTEAAMALLRSNWSKLKAGKCDAKPQEGVGSYHTLADLDHVRKKYPFEWEDRVSDWKVKYGLR